MLEVRLKVIWIHALILILTNLDDYKTRKKEESERHPEHYIQIPAHPQ